MEALVQVRNSSQGLYVFDFAYSFQPSTLDKLKNYTHSIYFLILISFLVWCTISCLSEALDELVRLKVTTAALRTIDKRGGLDKYMLSLKVSVTIVFLKSHV